MRRVRILFYWLFLNKNNINFFELLKFLIKPKVDVIAKKFIKKIDSSDEYNKVTFLNLNRELYWPKKFAVSGIFQVTAETFDTNDWHYYQYEKTPVEKGEILLDIGTAEGLFPLVVLDKCSHIYMVEPSQYFFNSLAKTFEQDKEKTTPGILGTYSSMKTYLCYTKNNGNFVKVRHNGTYTTQYLHMSKIKPGIRKGVYVKQGETIGYVGSTGLATGPHVCYRFWKNGKQVDPYMQKLPPGDPIQESNKKEYFTVKDSLMNILNNTY